MSPAQRRPAPAPLPQPPCAAVSQPLARDLFSRASPLLHLCVPSRRAFRRGRRFLAPDFTRLGSLGTAQDFATVSGGSLGRASCTPWVGRASNATGSTQPRGALMAVLKRRDEATRRPRLIQATCGLLPASAF